MHSAVTDIDDMNKGNGILPVKTSTYLNNIDIFYFDFNDVNFYFEDICQENMYLKFLEKFFSDLRISSIFCLNGKGSVLEHLKKNHLLAKKKCVYIVDLDLDIFLGLLETTYPNLFYLPKNCFENFLHETSAIKELILEFDPKVREAAIQTRFDIALEISDTYKALSNLFKHFVLVRKFCMGHKTSEEKVFYDSKNFRYDDQSIVDFLKIVTNEMKKRGIDVAAELGAVNVNFSAEKHVSGKFVLYHLRMKLNNVFGKRLNHFEFCYRMVKNSKFLDLNNFIILIQNYLCAP